MTDRPADEAEPIEVEAVAEGESAAGPEGKAATRRRRRGWLFLLLWLLPVVLILALGYLIAGQPERLAAFLAGKLPDMASTADIERLAGRVSKIESEAPDKAQVDAQSAAINAAGEQIGAAAGELAALRSALEQFEERVGARLKDLDGRISNLEGAEPPVDPAVAARIEDHEERLAGLEARPMREDAAGSAADPGLAALRSAVATLQARVEGLEAAPGRDGLEAKIEAADHAAAEAGAAADKVLAELALLRDAVGSLDRSGGADAGVDLAAARLRFAVDTGAPFREELAAVQDAGVPGFGSWAARADQGLPTADALARRFKELARARTVRSPDGATGTPWLDDVIGRLSEVVSVRQVSKDLPGEGADASLGRAEAYIEEGDLAGAVSALGSETRCSLRWLAGRRQGPVGRRRRIGGVHSQGRQMIRLLWTLAKIGVVVAAAVWLAQRPGDVELRLGNLVIEAPTGAILVALLFFGLLAAFAYRFWLAIRRAPQAMRFGRAGRRREQGYRALSLGMVAVAAGAADEARRRAREADRLLDGAPLTLLLAAQAAQLDGDDSAARRFFQAMVDEPETSLLGLRGLMAQANRSGDRDEALAIAARAQKERPGTPWVLEALFDLRTANGDWNGASAALEALAGRKLVRGEDLRRRRAVIAVERSRLAEERGDKGSALSHARTAWKLDPALPAATARLARLEGAAGHGSRAEKLLRDGWTKAPHPLLGETLEALWSRLTPAVRFTQGQRLLKGDIERPETRSLLADLALAAGQQAEARKLVGPLAGEAASARICRQMASIAVGEGDTADARNWLARARLAPADPAWFCRACSAVSTEWSGACPQCGVFDSLEWRPPAPPAPGQAAAIAAIEQELETGHVAAVAAPSRTEAAREA